MCDVSKHWFILHNLGSSIDLINIINKLKVLEVYFRALLYNIWIYPGHGYVMSFGIQGLRLEGEVTLQKDLPVSVTEPL